VSQVESIDEALKALVDLDFEHTSLDNVLAFLAEVVPGLNIVIDPEIAMLGVDLTTMVLDLKVKAVPVGTVLGLVLGSDLGYKVEENYVFVATIEKLQQALAVQTFDVAEIVASVGGSDGERQEAVLELINLVKCTVNNMSDPSIAAWADEGGPASVQFLNGKLVVTQTEQALKKLSRLLEELGEGTSAPIQKLQGHIMRQPPKVFVVHGKDLGAKAEVARFLENLNLSTLVIAEQGRGTLTLVEIIERSASRVDFAVVLLTPDDMGAAAEKVEAVESEAGKLSCFKPRARQNVVFELGYLMAVLGRERVCALRKGSLEIFSELSDLHGVFCEEMDEAGGWKSKVAHALKSAGFDVDMNLLAE